MARRGDGGTDLVLRPIGVVRSPVERGQAMPANGVPAAVEVFPAYQPGLAHVEENTHLIVLTWFDGAQRDVLQASGRRPRPDGSLRGVFGLRSPDRPNPIGLHVARLVRREGGMCLLDRLDAYDGTPVVDIKRYSPSWDCVFAARSARDRRVGIDRLEERRADLLLAGERFHGEACAGVAVAARMVLHVERRWQVAPKDPSLRVAVGDDGCVADAVQAMTAATLGSGRLRVQLGPTVRWYYGDRVLVFRLRDSYPRRLEEALDAPEERLFRVEVAPVEEPPPT